LQERTLDGRDDADWGIYNFPYPDADDPQDEDENLAYHMGFLNRRIELGSDFKWGRRASCGRMKKLRKS